MITVDLPMEEAKLLLGVTGDIDAIRSLLNSNKIIKINGLSVVAMNFSFYTVAEDRWFGRPVTKISMDLVPMHLITPKEQLDAEEAVEKAKASLEAAQKVLESVKGKNN